MKVMSSTSQILIVSVLAMGLLACTDSVTRFEDFGDRVVDGGAPEPENDAQVLEDLPDISGTFLVALAAVIAPDPPFQFLAQIELDDTDNTVDITLTGLGRYDRMPVQGGEPLRALDVPVDNTGKFEAPLVGEIPGDANVITGSDLEVDVVLVGRIMDENAFCGEATGMILRPIELDIAGSTVGAKRVEAGMVGDQLPEPLSACPQ